eukprot:6029459-Alexandrium_andersonii.AAC.1
MDSGKSWQKVEATITRRASRKRQATGTVLGHKRRELAKSYPPEKVEQIVQMCEAKQLYTDDKLFPGDEEERFHHIFIAPE